MATAVMKADELCAVLGDDAEALFTLLKLLDASPKYARSGLRPVLRELLGYKRKLLLQLKYAPDQSHVLCPQLLLGVLVIAQHMSACQSVTRAA